MISSALPGGSSTFKARACCWPLFLYRLFAFGCSKKKHGRCVMLWRETHTWFPSAEILGVLINVLPCLYVLFMLSIMVLPAFRSATALLALAITAIAWADWAPNIIYSAFPELDRVWIAHRVISRYYVFHCIVWAPKSFFKISRRTK